MTTGGDDRLSELSDDLLRRILYFVSSRDAASTSLLSRRWGSLFRTSGAVNLAVQVHGYKHLRYGRSISSYQEAEEAFFSNQEIFVDGAKAALDAAEAPITRLTLRVDSDDNDAISKFLCRSRARDTKVDVVGAVVSHKELRVAAAVNLPYRYLHDVEAKYRHEGYYGLASLPSETLCVLDLTGSDLTRSSSALMAALPLPRLATLRLRFCSVELELLQAMSDAAPELTTVQLESLLLLPPDYQQKTRFDYPDELDGAEPEPPPVLRLSFQAATTLVLALCGMPEQDDRRGRSRWAIEIDAPRLQSFKYKGFMRRFFLRSAAPGLARADLHFLRRDPDPYNQNDSDNDSEKEIARMLFWQFLHNFTNAKTLKLKVGNDLKDIAAIGEARRARLLCVFPRVERLELEGVHLPKSKTAAVAIANLLHCCPVLGEIVLKLTTATALRDKDSRYGHEFLQRKDRSDYNKSMDRFVSRWKSKTTIAMEDSNFGDNKYDDVPGIPGLSGRSFACLQRTLRRVGLQFRLDNNSISSCLGLRLIKFFAEHAMVLEEMSIDTGNRRLDEHLNFNVETRIALAPIPISATASIQHKNLAERSSEFSRISTDSTTDLAKSTVGFTVLPLQRQEWKS
ncbi:hypothetical protein BDA96_09G116100 [Sorghum bicolor]|uniref:F-box domain-containing protein n=2 Tax=Sorghum bicolor TaxID=4558 RepID=A0A921U4S1_SORBI|nr:hypothetical protein BDA96_09G116100 [Sorghum bicolor]KXG21814.1 hypothetical protein SORBI_3009G110800 [Sorghum bicolor]